MVVIFNPFLKVKLAQIGLCLDYPNAVIATEKLQRALATEDWLLLGIALAPA